MVVNQLFKDARCFHVVLFQCDYFPFVIVGFQGNLQSFAAGCNSSEYRIVFFYFKLRDTKQLNGCNIFTILAFLSRFCFVRCAREAIA